MSDRKWSDQPECKMDHIQTRLTAEIACASKPILFPEARAWGDLFIGGEPRRYFEDLPDGTRRSVKNPPPKAIKRWLVREGGIYGEARLQGLCSLRDRDYSLHKFDCKPELLKAIPQHMLLLDNDTMTFQITERSSGTALVTIQYSLILGSRWLAIIDPATIPKGVQK